MDQIKTQLDNLAELSNEQVTALQDTIVSEFDRVEQDEPTLATVDAMTELADALDTVRGEVKRREVQAEELTARAAEASARVRGEDIVDETGDELEPDADPAEDVVPTDEAPADEEVPVDEEKDKKPFPVKASADAEDATLSTEEVAPATETVEAAELSTEEVVVEAPAETELSTTDEVVVEESAAELAADDEAKTEDEDSEKVSDEETPDSEASAEVEDEAEASNSNETTVEPEAQEEAPVTAAADETVFTAPADRQPVTKATVAPVAITAGADVPGITAGSNLDSMDSVADAMAKRIHSLRRVNGGDGEQHIVASLVASFPEARTLGNSADDNAAKIKSVVGQKALMASGGFAAPLETSYDIAGYNGTDARPVRDMLPRFQADRGGIRFLNSPSLLSYAGATGIWENSTDIKASPTAGDLYDDTLRKNTLIVGGITEQSEYTYAVTLQLQFGNLMTRAFPELIARHNELALVQHARLAELTLLNKIDSKSTHIRAGQAVDATNGNIGFARDFLVTIKKAGAAYRSRHRIDGAINLRAIVPTWIMDAIAADLTLQMPGDGTLGIARNTIQGYLGDSNITLTESYDANGMGGQGEGALLDFPDQFTWYLFAEGSFLFLDGGTLDLGIIRDSGLVGTNDYKMFTETFEGLAFVGTEALAITQTVNITGGAAGLV